MVYASVLNLAFPASPSTTKPFIGMKSKRRSTMNLARFDSIHSTYYMRVVEHFEVHHLGRREKKPSPQSLISLRPMLRTRGNRHFPLHFTGFTVMIHHQGARMPTVTISGEDLLRKDW
jgi:hypothetical protein